MLAAATTYRLYWLVHTLSYRESEKNDEPLKQAYTIRIRSNHLHSIDERNNVNTTDILNELPRIFVHVKRKCVPHNVLIRSTFASNE